MVNFPVRPQQANNGAPLPARIRVAFSVLEHVYRITARWDASMPVRELSPLEKSVETAALRALQQYLLGEMDFTESPPTDAPQQDGSSS